MLVQQQETVASIIKEALATLDVTDINIILDRPKSAEHGDIACNIAMQLARVLKQKPRDIADKLVGLIKANPKSQTLFKNIEIAGPGFINFFLADDARFETIRKILTDKEAYGFNHDHDGESVLLEFVSANPTGPLHLGHARQGALGDTLANLL